MYMLDTDICIYVLKNRDSALRNKFKATRSLAISAITYGELCFGIENGHPDLLIAAHALSHEAVLVTNNQREFSRMTGLLCEYWP